MASGTLSSCRTQSSRKRCPKQPCGWTRSESIFDLDALQNRISKLEEQSSQPGFWADSATAQVQMQKLKHLRNLTGPLETLKHQYDEILGYYELLAEEPDEDMGKEADGLAAKFLLELDKYELITLLSGEFDGRNALVEINAGAGGSEACDWAEMLYRLYSRWVHRRGFSMELLSQTPGDVTGYRRVHFKVTGEYAYGYLKSEAGVHRLVRISPFDAASRRHTSFAKLEVLPEIAPTEVKIDPDDLKVETLRASGAGGQHVNKTESAVRITHIPSGIVVNCQNERSQHKNRAAAMLVLASRLAELHRLKDAERLDRLRGDSGPAEWGRQIRSYVMQPYTMVKDHRTRYETGNVQAIMDGEIDDFIEAFLRLPKSGSGANVE